MTPLRFVRVSSLLLAPRMAQGWAQQVVSLLDPDIRQLDTPQFNVARNEHHTEYMFDEEQSRTFSKLAPSYAAIVRILNFVRHDTRVLVHCHAGMSHSPSIAMILLIARGYPATEAVKFILAQNLYNNEGSYMEPNELILRHADRRLGLGDSLVSLVRKEMR